MEKGQSNENSKPNPVSEKFVFQRACHRSQSIAMEKVAKVHSRVSTFFLQFICFSVYGSERPRHTVGSGRRTMAVLIPPRPLCSFAESLARISVPLIGPTLKLSAAILRLEQHRFHFQESGHMNASHPNASDRPPFSIILPEL
jgi:hypothetical protein